MQPFFTNSIYDSMVILIFKNKSGKEIGLLKKLIKDAILDGDVKNNKEDALLFLNKKAEEFKIERNEI